MKKGSPLFDPQGINREGIINMMQASLNSSLNFGLTIRSFIHSSCNLFHLIIIITTVLEVNVTILILKS